MDSRCVFLLILILLSFEGCLGDTVQTFAGNTVTLGDLLDENVFVRSDEGWSSYLDVFSSTDKLIDFRLAANGNGIQGSDNGQCAWYFELAVSCLQDKSTTFNGILQITLGHTSFNDYGIGVTPNWDVMLWGDEHRVRLGTKNIFQSYTNGLYQTYNIPLNSSGNWVYVDTGLPMQDKDMIQALSAVSLLRIRGGQYSGPETAVLKNVRWYESASASSSSSSSTTSSNSKPIASSGSSGCQAKCRDGRRHYISTSTQILASSSGVVSMFQFTNVPLMCTSGLLEITATGALFTSDSFLQVLSEEGEVIGNIFQKGFPDAKNPGVYITDTLYPAISKTRMVRYAADRVITFSLSIPATSTASNVVFKTATLSFGSGACYRSSVTRQATTSPFTFPFSFTGVYNAVSQAVLILTIVNPDPSNTPDSLTAANAFTVTMQNFNGTLIDSRFSGKIATATQFFKVIDQLDINSISTQGNNVVNGTVTTSIGVFPPNGMAVQLELVFAPEYCYVTSAIVDRGQMMMVPDGTLRDEFGYRLRADVGNAYWPAPVLIANGLYQCDLSYLFPNASTPVADVLILGAAFWQTAIEDRSVTVHTAKVVNTNAGSNPTIGPSLARFFAQSNYDASNIQICSGGVQCNYAQDPSLKYPITDSTFIAKSDILSQLQQQGNLIFSFSHNPGYIDLFYVTVGYAITPPS